MSTVSPLLALRYQPKLQEACERLTAMARQLRPGTKLPTINELSVQLQVSRGTLHTALGELEQRDVIHRVHGNGIFVSPRLLRHVALICSPGFFQGSSHSPFWDALVDGLRRRAEANQEAFSCHFSLRAEAGLEIPLHTGLISEVMAGRVQGVIGVGLEQAAVQWIEAQGVPVVGFAGCGTHLVQLDMDHLISEGVRALAARGCRRIGLWHPVMTFRLFQEEAEEIERAALEQRLRIWREAAQRQGTSTDENLVKAWSASPASGNQVPILQEQGFLLAQETFSETEKASCPDGVVIADDMMTLGALAAFARLGIEVERDIQIATHANRNSHTLLGRDHNLLKIDFDPQEISQALFNLLEELMTDSHTTSTQVYIRPRINH